MQIYKFGDFGFSREVIYFAHRHAFFEVDNSRIDSSGLLLATIEKTQAWLQQWGVSASLAKGCVSQQAVVSIVRQGVVSGAAMVAHHSWIALLHDGLGLLPSVSDRSQPNHNLEVPCEIDCISSEINVLRENKLWFLSGI